jgi:ornithine racemase
MSYPCLKIYLDKIFHNSSIVRKRYSESGISVVGVTKCVLGDIEIAETMKNSGIEILGDSRLRNLERLRNFYGRKQTLIMLRSPMPDEVERLVEVCDISLNTRLETIKLIDDACRRKKIKHRVIVMVETDDDREGLLPENVTGFCVQLVKNYRFVELYGLGTNARCITKNGPSPESLKILIDLHRKVKKATGADIPVVSGGNSSSWNLIEKDLVPGGINQVRIGEAILMGQETVNYRPIRGAHTDTFILEAQTIEVKKKNNRVYKIIVALGLQDVRSENILCCESGLYIAGQSSDHTILGIKENVPRMDKNGFLKLKSGSIISFKPDYFGVLSCMTSPFVKKKYIGGENRII